MFEAIRAFPKINLLFTKPGMIRCTWASMIILDLLLLKLSSAPQLEEWNSGMME